ncbi:glycosyl hydrolase [Variovorax ginsengisoli]|uniref:Glycosyl hydrolase n=1 Tax=Variovorax ginsengisoli TaxID=363844 RepID=A0ABT8SDE1_9BURK|nr:glycosyl hydrolase [Variovorax ginsengisoli]MDN8617756.1 glycosyl hydrolase [Variovorax ginsengisoli]MDO1536926.1 glycosyl hydrolase [Variovorax ginsengisoli]
MNFRLLEERRRLLAATLAAASLVACGGGGGGGGAGFAGGGGSGSNSGNGSTGSGDASASASTSAGASDATPPASPSKSTRRGIAYDLATEQDMAALAPGVSWWYDWGLRPNVGAPSDHAARFGMDFVPMLWGDFDDAQALAYLQAHPEIRHLLLLNEPNLTDQANLTPVQAAQLWPRYESIAARTGVQLVGPAMTWGTMPGFADPVVWLDAFYGAYRAANGNRDPQIDYLGLHWYDYGLESQLDRLKKYGKSFWVTEFANWHNGDGSAQIDTVDKQRAQMTEMVALCESRADVFRYAWFTGRWTQGNDPHHTSLLADNGELMALGSHYLRLPY